MDNEEISGFEDAPSNITFIVFMGLFLIVFIYFMIVALHQSSLRSSQEDFQRGLTNAVKAYSTSYSTDPEALKYLSEGYLLSEDMQVYGVNSNPVQIDRNVASEYFFKILDSNVPQSEALLKSCGVYLINIITEFTQSGSDYIPTYMVSIYKDGNTALVIDAGAESLEKVQEIVETYIGDIKIDIAKDYNASLHEAQKYKSDGSLTGDNQMTYSTYTTTMTIIKDVPMSSLFGFVKKDVKEIQTYSVTRGDE